jgi:hypothetical protein
MTHWVLLLFGKLPILVVTRTEYEVAESEESTSSETPTHLGGSAHNFTLAEQFVDERYEPWDEGKFGFRRPQ